MDVFPQDQQRLPRRESLGLSQLHLKRFSLRFCGVKLSGG